MKINTQEYITLAIEGINKSSERIQMNNSYYYRNRLIDYATSRFANDQKNLRILYDRVYEDRAEDECRASHHGVAVGDLIKYHGWNKNKKDYVYRLSQIKALFKFEINKNKEIWLKKC
jgi:hypothetical protein